MWPVVWKPPEVWEQSTEESFTGAAYLLSELFWSKSSDVHLICDKNIIYFTEQ